MEPANSVESYDAFVDRAWFYDHKKPGAVPEVPYLAIALFGETGEIAEKVKKGYRDALGEFDKKEIAKELGDVLFYLTKLLHLKNHTLTAVLNTPIIAASLSMDIPPFGAAAVRLCAAVGRIAERVDLSYSSIVEDRLSYDQLVRVLCALSQFAVVCGESLASVAAANIEKIESRKARGTLHGEGDNR